MGLTKHPSDLLLLLNPKQDEFWKDFNNDPPKDENDNEDEFFFPPDFKERIPVFN